MRLDSRLSRMLHVLLHMSRHNKPFTSEQIAKMLNTNPVVVRRTMGGLKRAGFVRSVQGLGGGWTIAVSTKDLTLLDVYHAVGSPRLFLIGADPANQPCGVARVVEQALEDALRRSETILLERFARTTLAALSSQFDALCRDYGWTELGPPQPPKASRRRK